MMNTKQIFMDAETAYMESGIVYLFGSSFNMLYSYDINTKRIEILGKIPKYEFISAKLIGRILKWKDKIILLPFMANEVWIWDMGNGQWQEIEIEDASSYKMLFYQGFIHHDEIHMIGCYYPAIVRINMNTMDLSYDRRIYDEIDNSGNKNDGIYFRTEYIKNDNTVIMGCCNTNRILKYNLDSYEYELAEVGDKKNDYEGVTLINDHMVLFGRHEQSIFNLEGKQEKKEIPEEIDCHYMATVLGDGKYILLSSVNGNSCVIDDAGFSLYDEQSLFCEKTDNCNYIYVSNQYVLNIVVDGKKMLSEKLWIKDAESEKKFIDLLAQEHVMAESELVSLELFVKAVSCREDKNESITG